MPQELILTFHGLGEPADAVPDEERALWVPAEWFQAIVEALPRTGVGVAFDDGNASDVRLALPALREREKTARFFPLTGRLGAAGYVSAQDLAELSAAGMAIGSHGRDHSDWRTLGDDELAEELTASRTTLAEILDGEIVEAACPFGSYDRRVLRALRVAGYRRVFTSDGGAHAAGSRVCSRTTVNRLHPLQHWLRLASADPRSSAGPLAYARRLYKRVR